MNTQMEKMCRTKYVGKWAELPSRLWRHYFPSTSMCSPKRRFSEPSPFWVSTEASSLRHDGLLTPFSTFLFSQENGGQV